ncbi:lipopolysaccharide biosynthesis protein [Methylovulum psychrotolerans]|uniref:Polysaccharide biosynthesis protein C-terminal domain-containing protein n=1 Tax=Methylovulum psychrotolerans TaxID=1704499 RepID=A0A1Z4BWK7_9GAMM|nr:oligosaccharide flippase family protein [Methylovulum psychrotolerans]ASF45696.1 hypothetical protein CEK71_06195 [Methylovulum psychrotolerans]
MASTSTHNYFITFSTSVFIQLCTILQGIILARMLGADGRGEYAAIILWPNLFAGIGILGINMAIARRAGQIGSSDNLVGIALLATFLTASATSVIAFFSLPYVLSESVKHLLPIAYVFLWFIPLNHLGMNLQAIDHGRGHFGLYNVTRGLIYPVFLLGLGVCWFWVENKLYGVIIAQLLSNAVCVFLRLATKIRGLLYILKGEFAKIICESMPFFKANILELLTQQFDKVLLIYLLPTTEIGFYMVALSSASVINSLCQSLGIVAFTNAAKRKTRTGFPVIITVLRRAGIFSMLGAAALGVCLPWLVPLIYGIAFVPAINITLILLPGIILSGLSEITNQDLRGQGQPMAGMFARIVGLLAFAIAALFLAQTYGAQGIAISYVIGVTINFFGMLIIVFRFYRDVSLGCFIPRYEDVNFIWRRLGRRDKKIQ